MHRQILTLTALAGALVLGCADQPAPSEPAAVSLGAFRTEQDLESSGAIIIRNQQDAVFRVDQKKGFTVMMGWTFAELERWCETGAPRRLEELNVFRPQTTEELRDQHYLLRGAQVPVLVWEVVIGEPCGDLLLLPHLTGAGNYTQTWNDLFSAGTRATAAHEGFQGQVTSEAGERFKFSERFHIVALPSGEIVSFTFEFELKPIGA